MLVYLWSPESLEVEGGPCISYQAPLLWNQLSVQSQSGSQDLERSAVGRPNAEVCAQPEQKVRRVKDLSSRVDGRPVFVPPRATISSDGKKALKQLRENHSDNVVR
ncbi:hypothetical protein D4764_10G0011950 [Takifugu flavidus]|uniref:Uncharacterized protein n=1 Tax=Takifugu flavidus TaxID=433684 RepID=A0A5C6PL36_9TELE|nr:hypothetical protein D4764_10G0011950 [Takifugu flavidus]